MPPLREVPDALRTMIQTGGENDSTARELARFIRTAVEKNVAGMTVSVIYRRDRYLRGGDHSPFLDAGFPAVRMTEPNEDFRHQHQDLRRENGGQLGDLPEFCDFDYIANVARVNAAALGTLALAPAVPQEVKIETKELTNNTTLQRRANSEPDLAGYQIVWREMTATFWQSITTGNATQLTVSKVSKDNYLFGSAP